MRYCVYRADFVTNKNTRRTYIGQTGNAEHRADKLMKNVAWCTPSKPGTLQFNVVAMNIETLHVALFIEALFAARAIVARPLQTRGGPWLSLRPLGIQDMMEVRATARCKNLLEFADYAQTLPFKSRLREHLANVRFTDDRPSQSSVLVPSSSSVSSPLIAAPRISAQPKAKAKAQPKVKAKAKAKPKPYKPPRVVYKLVRESWTSGTSEAGHDYRTRNAICDGDWNFNSCKYGKKPRSIARKPHDEAYDLKRVRRKPAAT